VYDGHMRDSETIELPENYTVNRDISPCCGGPYPTITTSAGIRICTGCARHIACDCDECENERALDEDADRRSER
jgi:hypothetical protein